MKKAWTTQLVGAVKTLEKLDPLISPLIVQHYVDITAGKDEYRGLRRNVGDVRALTWD